MNEAAAPLFDPVRHRRGGRPRKAPEALHGQLVVFRVTPEQKARAEAKAAEAGLSLSEYGRRLFTGESLTIEVAPIPPPEIIRQLRMMGNNLNQALHEARQRGFAEAERQALEQAVRSVSVELRMLLHGPEH